MRGSAAAHMLRASTAADKSRLLTQDCTDLSTVCHWWAQSDHMKWQGVASAGKARRVDPSWTVSLYDTRTIGTGDAQLPE